MDFSDLERKNFKRFVRPLEETLNNNLFSNDVELDLLPAGIFIFSVMPS